MKTLSYVFSNFSFGRSYCREETCKDHSDRTKDNACVVFDGTKVIFASETERFTHEKHDFNLPWFALEAFKRSIAGRKDVELEVLKAEGNDLQDHHLHHIYECFYQSGFRESAVLVHDGKGSRNECITLAYMKEGSEPLVLKKYSPDVSPCNLYALASWGIFGDECSEGKLMGLAGYGKENGNFREYVGWNFEKSEPYVDYEDGRKALEEFLESAEFKEQGVMAARDFAYAIQSGFEGVLIKSVEQLSLLLQKEGIKTDNLCLSGGGILNCPSNSKIVDLGLFKHYYASPQPCDGCAESIGKAYQKMQHEGQKMKSRRLKSAYLGTRYGINEVKKFVSGLELQDQYSPYRDLCDHLNSQGIIAWYQGGAEYGPRALGHRSFLADPSLKSMMDTLNKIKGREEWRPLAPVVPECLFPLIFEESNYDMCEFMLRTLTVKKKWQPKLQAVCHVDGTTRPQLLKRETNPQLYDLLTAYFDLTGVPCLVNTSLNVNGFPIVETPFDLCCLTQEIYYKDKTLNFKTVFVEDKMIYELNFKGTWECFKGKRNDYSGLHCKRDFA